MPQDYAQAANWFRKAADQGHASAQSNLGNMYSNGRGVPQNYAEARKWRGLAADQGNATAQYNLGHMYDIGQGTPQDFVQAHMWFNLAAAASRDETDRADAVRRRENLASRMTPSQVAEAQRRASAWKPK